MITVETWSGEDLDLGTGPVTKTAPGGGTLNCHQVSLSTFSLAGAAGGATTQTWVPGAIPAGGVVSTTINVPGAVLGDKVLVSHDQLGSNALQMTAHVQAAGIVRVVIANNTGSLVTLASGTLSVLVFHHA